MQNDEAILTEQSARDLCRAIGWCKREWFCLLLGGALCLVGLVPFPGKDLPLADLPTAKRVLAYSQLGVLMVGLATGLVGWFLSVPSSFFAFLGILFPGRSGRHRFLLFFVVSALPFAITMWAATNVRLFTVEEHKSGTDSEQDAAHIFQKPRTVSENGER